MVEVEDKILLCLLSHLTNPTAEEKSIMCKLRQKVIFNQLEIDF